MNKSFNKILDNLWELSQDGYRLDLLNEHQRTILQIELFENSVNSGGLNSTFYNEGGEFIYTTLKALEDVDSTITLKLLRQAILLFPEPLPSKEEFYEFMLKDSSMIIDRELIKISNRFYKHEENLTQLKLNYIYKHKDEFNLDLIEGEDKVLNDLQSSTSDFYVVEVDDNFQCLIKGDALDAYSAYSFHLGMDLDLPKITLSANINELPDVLPNFQRVFIINQKVKDIFDKHKLNFIQYFGVDIVLPNGTLIQSQYHSVNIINHFDAVDKKKSVIEWSDIDDDEDEEDRYPISILELYINVPLVKDEKIFKLNQMEQFTFLSADLVKELIENNIKGFCFTALDNFTY